MNRVAPRIGQTIGPFSDYCMFLLRHRNISNLISRAIMIFRRYGITSRTMEDRLDRYIDLMGRHDCVPSLSITATVSERHPKLIQKLNARGVDFGVHGYRHANLANYSSKRIREEIAKAVSIFQQKAIPFRGFRCPYLRWNKDVLHILQELHFSWDSSHSIAWNAIEGEIPEEKLPVYQKHLERNGFKRASDWLSLPRFCNNLVEIPVSLPTDDMLIDQLGIIDSAIIERIWGKILSETHDRGELFVLQLHPERIAFCKVALKSLLETSKAYRHPIWIASLSEISSWWREKSTFGFRLNRTERGRYRIQLTCSDRCTVLIKNIASNSMKDFFNGYKVVVGNEIQIETSSKPAIGVSKKASPNLIPFLKNEGFFFEVSDNREEYGIYLDGDKHTPEDEVRLLNLIEGSQAPIMRFWRWPDGARSALAATGDVCALTSFDFLLRLFGG